MQEFQIAFGGGSDWAETFVAALGPALVGALAALGGAWLTHVSARQQRKIEIAAQERLRFIEAAEAQEKADVDRQFAAYELARHLERYAAECADQVTNYTSGPHIGGRCVFPKWKLYRDLDWRALGIKLTVRARDFERRRKLHSSVAWGTIEVAATSETDADEINADAVSKIGLEAWGIAEQARRENGIGPFDAAGSWDFAATLIEYRKELEATAKSDAAELARQQD